MITTEELNGKLQAFTQSVPLPPASYFDQLQRTSNAIIASASASINFAAPILTRVTASGEREPVIYRKTLNAVTGKTGTHKSRLGELLASSFLAHPANSHSLLGFQAALNEQKYCVILIDTERNLSDQLPFAVQEIREKAGYKRTENIPNFEVTSLLSIRREERLRAMTDFFAAMRDKHKGKHLICILDVITDVCENFNDPRHTMPLVDELNSMINNYDVTILAITHQNPSDLTDKARGHLGSELENKASTILTVGLHKDQEGLYAVRCKKQRSAKPFGTFYVRYDEQARGLREQDAKIVAAITTLLIDWELVFGADTEISASELQIRLMKRYGFQKRQSQNYISDSIHREELLANGKGKARKLRIAEKDLKTEQLYE
jgi:hypothetical protein